MTFDSFPKQSSAGEKTEDIPFPPESKEAISLRFLQILREEKISFEEQKELIRGIVGDESIEAFTDLSVLSRTLQRLVKDESINIEEKTKMVLQVHLLGLSPIGSRDVIPGVNSYAFAAKSVIEILQKILTPDVFGQLSQHFKKIFIPPAEDYFKQNTQ